MSTSSTSIIDLADESLAHIFAFLPPIDRVRLERVCRKWQKVVKKYAWTEFRMLKLDKQELVQRGYKAVLKYQALIDRCTPHLREMSVSPIGEFSVEQLTKMRNLRHLHFDHYISSDVLRAVANNLMRLQSIHFSDNEWYNVTGLHEILGGDVAYIQALRLPLDSFRYAALPSSLRSLCINVRPPSSLSNYYEWKWKCGRVDVLLEIAASCCPQLAMLMLPIVSEQALVKLARFENLSYLSLCYNPFDSDANLLAFGNSLAIIGASLRALLLGPVDSEILHLIAKHCPLLEHFSSGIIYDFELLSALQSVFELGHLRSVSIRYVDNIGSDDDIVAMTQAIELNVKGNIEYLNLCDELPLSVLFITNLVQHNPKLRKLACAIQDDQKPEEMVKLKKLLQNIDKHLELELYKHCPPELELGKNNKVRIRKDDLPESISQPMLREFLARTMDSVPDLDDLDD